jgi:hypothetical protein
MAPLLLEELKILILQKSGIRVISPSDCATIALEITKTLKKNISETTIKRLFGFAALKHRFSKFTVNTLLEYVEGEEMNEVIHSDLPSKTSEDWEFLVNRGKQISEQTIQYISDHCDIPYEYSIPRKCAVHDFDYFYSSDFSFTAFVSQPGYGKSIMLSHLVNDHFLQPDAKYSNDVVLFIPAFRIFKEDKDIQNVEEELKKLLGISSSQSLISYFQDFNSENNGKLILMIDAFNEVTHQNKKLKNEAFDSIIQLFCDIEDSQAIKVVLNMRSYIWRRFFETIRHSHYLKSKWYTGSYYRCKQLSNVPVLTDTEVEQWLRKIGVPSNLVRTPEMQSHFKHPFNLAYYFQLKHEFSEIEYSSNLVFYEITLRYLNQKIYQSKYAAEKLVICKQLILFSNAGKLANKVSKSLLINELRLFRDAYMELLMDGIIIEELQNDDFFLTEWIQFVQPHIFDYFLFKELIESQDEQSTTSLFTIVYQEYQDQKRYKTIINWLILHFVKKNEFNLLTGILSIPLPYEEQNELLLFFVENIYHQTLTNQDALQILVKSNLHQDFIVRFTELDFFSPILQKALNVLSKLSPNQEALGIYQSILCLQDALTFNKEQLQLRLVELNKIQYPITWQITPTAFATFVLMNFNGESTISFKLSENENKISPSELTGAQVTIFFISKLYAIMASWFNEAPLETAKIIQEVYQVLPIHSYKSNSLSAYIFHILAMAAVKLGPSNEVNQLCRTLGHLHHFELSKKQTEWTKGLYQLVLAHVHYHEASYNLALERATESIVFFKKQENFALELLATHMIINIYLKTNDVDHVNENRCYILNELENRKVHTKLFDITRQQLKNNFSF